MFISDFGEGFVMPTAPPPTPGGVLGYMARDRFDAYVDLDKVGDFMADAWMEYLDSDPFTKPKKPKEPGEYYWAAPNEDKQNPCNLDDSELEELRGFLDNLQNDPFNRFQTPLIIPPKPRPPYKY